MRILADLADVKELKKAFLKLERKVEEKLKQ